MLAGRFELGGRLRTFDVLVAGHRCATTNPDDTPVLRVGIDADGVVVEAEASDITEADLQQVADKAARAIGRVLEERANPPAPHEVTEPTLPTSNAPPVWRPRTGLVITGVSVSVGGYISAIIGALSTPNVPNGDNGAGWLYVPIVGPFVAGAVMLGQHSPLFDNGLFAATDIITGVVEVAGAIVAVIGFVGSRRAPAPPPVTWSALGATVRW